MHKKILIALVLFLLVSGAYVLNRQAKETKLKKEAERLKELQRREEVNIRIPEGWGIDQIAENFQEKNLISKKVFLTELSKTNLSKYPKINSKPKNVGLEGFLFPDTYRIFKPTGENDTEAAQEIIAKALSNFELKFTDEMQKQAKNLGYTVYEIVTLASILEKETGRNAVTEEQKKALDEERKIVAGIFYNRLKIGMALQSDATVNYVTNKNNPTPTLEDLDTESLYNTYKYRGLPPGPIASPSLSSLLAALYPTDSEYFYFLHKQPSGEPVYSKTFEEHTQNKFKYLK
jgi:UPF0755 protein